MLFPFWSSVELTGNPTRSFTKNDLKQFWSSVELTGNPTYGTANEDGTGFGAVSN